MNTKEDLLQKYTDNDNQLGKRELGQLRRILLTEVLDNIISNDCLNADKWLDNRHKLHYIADDFHKFWPITS